MRSRHSMSRAVCPSSSSGTVTIRDMMTILGNPQYSPRMNPPAPPRRQNRQPRRSEAEPRWMMVFAYVLYVPAGISLTSAYTSQLLASALHVAVSARALFVIIVGAVVLVAYLGIKVSSSVDLVLVAGEVATVGRDIMGYA